MTALLIALLILLLFSSAYFSAAETALFFLIAIDPQVVQEERGPQTGADRQNDVSPQGHSRHD